MRQPRLECPIDGLGQEGQPNACGGLLVEGVRKPGQAHLVEHAADPLSQLLSEVLVRTNSRHPWISSVSRSAQWVGWIDQSREPSRTRNLNTVCEYLHPDMVASEAIRAVHDRVDQPLEPSVLRDQWHIVESPPGGESPSHGLSVPYQLLRLDQLTRDRPFNGLVTNQLLPRPSSTFPARISEHPDEGLRQETLGVGRKEQSSSNRQSIPCSETSGPKKTHDIRMSDSRGVVPDKVMIEDLRRGFFDSTTLIRAVPAVVEKLLALTISQTTILVADTQENVISSVCIYRLPGANIYYQEILLGATFSATWKENGVCRHWRLTELNMCLHQLIAMACRPVGTLHLIVVNTDHHRPSVGICETDQGVGKVTRSNAKRLALKPLVLGNVRQRLTNLLDGQAEDSSEISR
jgi:hypothetical protein